MLMGGGCVVPRKKTLVGGKKGIERREQVILILTWRKGHRTTYACRKGKGGLDLIDDAEFRFQMVGIFGK